MAESEETANTSSDTMPQQLSKNLVSLFGTVLWGDIGPLTLYRNKNNKLITFMKTWPKEPPSDEQLEWRQKFRTAAAAWQALSTSSRSAWDGAARRAGLCMSGYNLFVHWQIKQDTKAIQTIERQTGISLLP